ncbi:MAG: SIMPL domain-containing protein [Paracoccaceae bacterium]
MSRLKSLSVSTALALLFAHGAMADTARTITVTGEGIVETAPDQATISLGVTTNAETAVAALAANSEAMAKVMEQLKAAGVDAADLQTANLSLNPNWSGYDSSSNPEIAGYVASNLLNVRVRDLDDLGTILDAAVTDGANTMNGITFGLSEPNPVMNEARTRAVADATSRAGILAMAAGATLGPIVSITEGGTFPGPAPMFRAEASAVPIASGELAMTASVTVTFEIAE